MRRHQRPYVPRIFLEFSNVKQVGSMTQSIIWVTFGMTSYGLLSMMRTLRGREE
jgi:hypothetical protein